ncbi:hypothetical protein Btru_009883 [Bulinus truncatus]|nr:hypothetical protein Btru_009883 [Bulinus truncatus]
MFTNTYFSFESSRRFLTARTRTPYPQPFYEDRDHHVEFENLINLNRGCVNEGRCFITVDSSIPFADYLRNLSESLSRSAKNYSQDLETEKYYKNVELDTKQTSSENKRRHNFDKDGGEVFIPDIDKQGDTLSKVNMCKEHTATTGEEKFHRLQQCYSFRDVLQDPCKEVSLPLGMCHAHQYDRLSRHVASTAVGHRTYHPADYFHHQQIDQGRCGVLREGLAPHQHSTSSSSNNNINNRSSSLLDCHLSHLTQATQLTIDDRLPRDESNVCYINPGNLDLACRPFDRSPETQHCKVPQTSDRCLLPQDLAERSVTHPVSKSQLVKKYKCEVCHKAFSRSNTLLTHKRIHTGDKPFICDICGRAFRQPGNLTRHRLTHSPYKPFVCPVCRKAFNRIQQTDSVTFSHGRHDDRLTLALSRGRRSGGGRHE